MIFYRNLKKGDTILFSFLLFFLVFFNANGQDLIKNKTQNIHILSFEYIHDVENQYTSKNIIDATFENVTEPDLNWGKKNGYYWFKVAVKSNKNSEYAFNIPTIHIDSVNIYENRKDALVFMGKSGNKVSKKENHSMSLQLFAC